MGKWEILSAVLAALALFLHQPLGTVCQSAGQKASPGKVAKPFKPPPCACNRGLFPTCSSTSGAYVASSPNCAEECGGYFYTVECLFLRYYSWRRQCSCTMELPDRFGGFCQKTTGIVVTRDAECLSCQKLDASGLEDCDKLAEQGINPRLPPAVYEIESFVTGDSLEHEGHSKPSSGSVPFMLASTIPPRQEFCNRSQDLTPACSMATGIPLNMTGCEAGMQGMIYTMPCEYLEGMSTVPYFQGHSPLMSEEAPKFIGRVAGYAGCMSVVHKCHEFQRRDGAMIHVTVMESPDCAEEADKVIEMFPECEAAIENGTHTCTENKARRVFQAAVSELCRPFGAQDFGY